MNSIEKKIRQRLTKQRKIAGLSQAELAEKVGVHPETISRIETGHRRPSLLLIVELAGALDMELHHLFRMRKTENAKDGALEKLLWFGARLSNRDIELVMSVGASILQHLRNNER